MRRAWGLAVLAVAAALAGAAGWQAYSAEQTRQAGLQFGIELSAIQDDLKSLQDGFVDLSSGWDGMDGREAAGMAAEHLSGMESLVGRYSDLRPPPGFGPSVELFRMSAQSQLESDREYVLWLQGGGEAHRSRSDALLQDAFELETAALGKFDRAKKGIPEPSGP